MQYRKVCDLIRARSRHKRAYVEARGGIHGGVIVLNSRGGIRAAVLVQTTREAQSVERFMDEQRHEVKLSHGHVSVGAKVPLRSVSEAYISS